MCLSSVLKREISSKDDQQLRREEELASRHFGIDREGMVYASNLRVHTFMRLVTGHVRAFVMTKWRYFGAHEAP